MVATFFVTHLIAMLQPSKYSIFHGKDTPIQLSLLWQNYSYQYLNTETSTQSIGMLPLKLQASPIYSVCI